MKIAYIVLAHKNIHQIRWLLEAIQSENVSIYLHIDRLSGRKIHQEAIDALENIQNLTYLRRYATSWGGFGLVKATLEGLRQIMLSGLPEYVILLSGQDYPVKPKEELEAFLQNNYGMSYMEYYNFPHPNWEDHGGFDRINRWFFTFPFKENRLAKEIRAKTIQALNVLMPRRKFPEGYKPYGGSQWWCLYQDCFAYINEFCKQNKKFVRFFKTVRIPDEIFFQTMLMNSDLANKIINRKLTYVDWNGPPYPRILSQKDLVTLKFSRYFFARKFDSVFKNGE
jgi:hypothetical protein